MIEASLAGYCIEQGHRWSGWSIWKADFPRVAQMIPADSEKPCTLAVRAYRDRLCRRCGCVEQEDRMGKRTIARDPHDIERHRQHG